eukprot:2669043-Alexandrium_andersonii.AAC.1
MDAALVNGVVAIATAALIMVAQAAMRGSGNTLNVGLLNIQINIGRSLPNGTNDGNNNHNDPSNAADNDTDFTDSDWSDGSD